MPNGEVTDGEGAKKISADGQYVYDTLSSGENISAPSDIAKRGTLQQHFGEKIGLSVEECLKKSYQIRLRQGSAHYETLRLLGGMKNHALDEILADCLGQIAAFGEFSAERHRIFFGLTKGVVKCDGRLNFYCQKVLADELVEIYEQ